MTEASSGPDRPPCARQLPLADAPPKPRRDAERNRETLLTVAAELVERRGAAAVTIDEIACAAGVGKGTVFRRFGSRAGLMAAIVDLAETNWQSRVMSGPPPLGPGASAYARLRAFGPSRIDLNLSHAELLAAADRAHARSYAAYSFAAMHVRYLLEELALQGDLGYLATALLAPLEVPILQQQVYVDKLPVSRLVDGWHDLVDRIVGPR